MERCEGKAPVPGPLIAVQRIASHAAQFMQQVLPLNPGRKPGLVFERKLSQV